jgi:hypothetical protein
MNRTDWLSSNDPMPMLDWLLAQPVVGNERKLRLFACACCRRLEATLRGHEQWLVREIERGEQMAEAGRLSIAKPHLGRSAVLSPTDERQLAANVVLAVSAASAWNAAWEVVTAIRALQRAGQGSADDRLDAEGRAQAALVRDIFGHMFQPRLQYLADVIAHPPVLALARTIYEDRSFAELPVLADALEDAGCTDEEMLEHCREPGGHVRGCWVVDEVLGNS